MGDLYNKIIPQEAMQVMEIAQELFGMVVIGVYLYGSATAGGLQVDSDVDILVALDQSMTEATRKKLAERLLLVSGKVGNTDSIRPLEVTVINRGDVVPWRYPPNKEFIYGEWLRGEFEQGQIPEPTYDPNLAILLYQARNNGIPLYGPEASDILPPVPMMDIKKAIKDSLSGLIESTKGDERNVILTLARMWLTVAEEKIASKDAAAEWAIHQMPEEQGALLDAARKAYLGEYIDRWEGLDSEVAKLVDYLEKAIERYLD